MGFQPGGLYRFLGIPIYELIRTDAFDGVDMLGNEMNEVNDRLKEARSFAQLK